MVSFPTQYSSLFFGHPVTINLYIQIVIASSYKPQIRLNKYSAYLKLRSMQKPSLQPYFIYEL